MTDKRKIPDSIRQRIMALHARGESMRAIAEATGVARHTVRRITDPDYAEAERERGRKADAARAEARRHDPAYRQYQSDYGKTPEHLAKVREYMSRRRKEGAEQI